MQRSVGLEVLEKNKACELVLDTLRQHESVPSVVIATCKFLEQAEKKSFCRALGEAGVCELVVAALRQHEADPNVQQQAGWAMKQLRRQNEQRVRPLGPLPSTSEPACMCTVM